MANRAPTISSHVLDTSRGQPAAGVVDQPVARRRGRRRGPAGLGCPRIPTAGSRTCCSARPLRAGTYRLRFDRGWPKPAVHGDGGRPARRRRRAELPRAAAAQPVRTVDLPRQLMSVAEPASSPSIEDCLNGPAVDRVRYVAGVVAPLFEGAPAFLDRLAAARPFESYAALWPRALEIARSMPEAEQLELINAHPRLGAPPATRLGDVVPRAGLRHARGRGS